MTSDEYDELASLFEEYDADARERHMAEFPGREEEDYPAEDCGMSPGDEHVCSDDCYPMYACGNG